MYEQNQKLKALALFDFDGTLYPHDSFTGFIFHALPKRHIMKRGIPMIPWILAYYANLYPAHKMRPRLYKSMFKHISNIQIQNTIAPYIQKVIKQLDPLLLQQLQQHIALQHDVVIVSATIDLYLKDLAEQLGIAFICSEVEIRDDILTGAYVTADCSNNQKSLRVQQLFNLSQYQQVYAYGNSIEDLDMLSLAHQAYMHGQDSRLPNISVES